MSYKIGSGTGGGTISGTISAGQVAYSSATDTIAGSNSFFWDNSTGRLGVGTNSPANLMHLYFEDGTGNPKYLLIENGEGGNLALAGLVLKASGVAVGEIIGTNSNAVGHFGYVNGITIGPGTSSQDIGFRLGADVRNGSASGPPIIFKSTGDVGVGTSSPTVYANYGPTIEAKGNRGSVFQSTASDGTTRGGFFTDSSQSAVVFGSFGVSNADLIFNVNGDERMKLLVNGRLGIGTSTPNALLHVKGESTTGGMMVEGSVSAVSDLSGTDGVQVDNDSSYGRFISSNGIQLITSNVTAGDTTAITIEDGGKIGIGTTTPKSTLDVNGSISVKRVTTATNYTVTELDHYIGVTDTTSSWTITLLAAATAGNGKLLRIKDQSGAASTNNIVVQADGTELIDSTNTIAISTDFGYVEIICDGSQWWLI